MRLVQQRESYHSFAYQGQAGEIPSLHPDNFLTSSEEDDLTPADVLDDQDHPGDLDNSPCPFNTAVDDILRTTSSSSTILSDLDSARRVCAVPAVYKICFGVVVTELILFLLTAIFLCVRRKCCQ